MARVSEGPTRAQRDPAFFPFLCTSSVIYPMPRPAYSHTGYGYWYRLLSTASPGCPQCNTPSDSYVSLESSQAASCWGCATPRGFQHGGVLDVALPRHRPAFHHAFRCTGSRPHSVQTASPQRDGNSFSRSLLVQVTCRLYRGD